MFSDIDCGTPPDLPHSTFTTPTGTAYTDIAVYTCGVGYVQVDTAVTLQSMCNAIGNWNPFPTECTGRNLQYYVQLDYSSAFY